MADADFFDPPTPGSSAADEVSRDDDPLAQALSWLTGHHGRPRSAESLLAGIPIDGALGPDQALRVLREAGFNAGMVQRRIADIHGLLLPAVLLLNNGDACVLVRRIDGQPGRLQSYEVVFPGPESHSCVAEAADLEAEYTGFCLLATPQQSSAQGVPTAASLNQAGGHWLWSTLRRFFPYYRASLLAAMLSNLLMMVTGLVTSVIYDKVIPHQAMVTLWTLAIGAFIALAFDLVARQLRSHLIDLAGRKSDLIIGSMLFRQTLGVRMEHRPPSAGSYAHHLAQIEVVRDFFASATMSALSDLPFIILFVAMTFVIGGPLGWVLVLALPIIVCLAALIQSSLRRSMSASMTQQADLQGLLVEAVEGLEDLKAAGAEGRFLHRYETSTAIGADAAMRARSMSSWSSNVTMVLQQLITMIMLVWGVYLIKDGQITAGALIGAVMFATRAIGPLGSVVGLATRYQGARAALVSLDALMNKPVEREVGRNYVGLPNFNGHMALQEVSFAYPMTGTDKPPQVLKSVSMRLNPGERVAILGRIGSGKSTILRLLAGLYQPSEGRVEVDGVDLRQIDPAEFRARVGFVSQEPRLFHGTLRDNVLLGRASADASQLTEVARLTGLDRLVASHPLGWDLPVGEMGSLLSGGQRQLVALARCLVTKPQILLMDEPTSSMDAQSEIAFLRQLKDAAGSCTLVMVTHRPAVLELVGRLMVVDAGRVVLDGPKDQVLAALSGQRPAAPEPAANPNVRMHPSAQPVQREATL
nr:type I secretion system permease/ATPase [uncultured Roseateles sp.]